RPRRTPSSRPLSCDAPSSSSLWGSSVGAACGCERGRGRGKSAGVMPVSTRGVEIRLLGPLTVRRDGVDVTLPAARKARALLAFLAVSPGAVTRSRLCEMLWDVPDDPRGELRWSLSKLRGVLDDDDSLRVVGRGETVTLDLSDCRVDVAQ